MLWAKCESEVLLPDQAASYRRHSAETEHPRVTRLCVTQMLAEHNLLSLQERRKHLRLVFLFKVHGWGVGASNSFWGLLNKLTPQRPNRAVRVRTFKDYVTSSPAISLILRLPTTADVLGLSKSNLYRHFYRAMHFAKRGIAIACRLSVCLSVCLKRWWIVIT